MRYCGIFIALLAALLSPVNGAELAGDELILNEVEQAAGEYGASIGLDGGIKPERGWASLKARASEHLHQTVREALGSCVKLFAVVLLCGLVRECFAVSGGDRLSMVDLTGTLAVAMIAVSDTGSLLKMGQQTIQEMDAFSDALIPAVAVLSAGAGAPASAAAGQAAAMLFSDLLITWIDRGLLPLIYAYIALWIAFAATGNEGLKRLAGLVKWIVTAALTFLLFAFVGYLTVGGVIAGSSDAMTIKAAKMAISGMIPVVGGILSDAAETVLAGAGILKNTVGVFGMFVVLGMCIVPFLQLGLHYLAYRVTGALSAAVGDSRLAGLIEGIGGAFGLILGMTGACAFLILIAVVSAVSLVVR